MSSSQSRKTLLPAPVSHGADESGIRWICCQLGAREHYAIPRVLNRHGELELLITDAWADSTLPWGLFPGNRAGERFHSELPSARVRSFDWSLLRFEFFARRRLRGWRLIMARNEWFQERALAALRALPAARPGEQRCLFAYSYAAVRLLQFARDAGWSTVLGQIDPGPAEEQIVVELHRRAGRPADANPAPPEYWDSWRRECHLADRIVVNSEWSCRGLLSQGISAEKIAVVPLAFEAPPEAAGHSCSYPAAFDEKRPLRVLFLGQVNLRKGAAVMLEAILAAAGLPVEFTIVGDIQIPVPPEFRENPRVKWVGAVPRGAAADFYRDADVFLFPSFSDGFGLTQLEAQAWNLPIIASHHCGNVVEAGENGFLLDNITAGDIVDVLKAILSRPALLRDLSARSRASDFTLDPLYSRLTATVAMNQSC